MIKLEFTEGELELIGQTVGGTFYNREQDTLVFSSHTFPAHRITVDAIKADKWLHESARLITANARAD